MKQILLTLILVGGVVNARAADNQETKSGDLKSFVARDGIGHVMEKIAAQLWQAAETLPPVDHQEKGASACFSPRMERAKIVPVNQSMLDDGWEPLQNLKEGNWDETQDGKHNQEPYFSSRAGKLWKATRAGATLTFRFQGNYCAIYDLLGPGCGIAEVTVDGPLRASGRRSASSGRGRWTALSSPAI